MTTATFDLSQCAERLAQSIERMGTLTDPGPGVTRTSLTEPYMQGLAVLESFAEELNLRVHYDAVGNFYASNAGLDQPSVAIGSHIDSVPHGGKYDGTAGVLCAFEVARALPQVPITVVSFIGEEGSRFPGGLLGSRCVAGQVSLADLQRLKDDQNVSFVEAARARHLRPEEVASCPRMRRSWTHYLEIHIEQGRVLQDEQLEIGLVTDIVGMVQASLTIHGQPDHAGATPMSLRSDAGITAAQVMLELQTCVKSASSTAVGTVGTLELLPGACNVIPGEARLSLDVRDRQAAVVDHILAHVRGYALNLAEDHHQTIEYNELLRSAPVALDDQVINGLEQSLQRLGIRHRHMISGAGHDAMLVAPFVPTGMLFVPCRDGISHAPDEYAEPRHLATAVATLVDYLENLS